MTARYFVDSNVLIYARDMTEAVKQQRAAIWLDYLWDRRAGYVSYQVLVECYSALIRRRRMAIDQARLYVESFLPWNPVALDASVLMRAWQTEDRFQFNWWDCLIVAAARLGECAYILTEDLQHGQNLDGIVVLDPFQVEPDAVQ